MPVTPTYPGVYVQEVPSGVRTIAGVGTSTAVFLGRARRGPLNVPVRCLSYTAFENTFSPEFVNSDLARSVRLFFENGGNEAWVVRLADGAAQSEIRLRNTAGADVLRVRAKSPGVIGDTIRIGVTYSGTNPESTFNLEVFRVEQVAGGALVQADRELHTGLTMAPDRARTARTFVTRNSALVEIEDLTSGTPAAGFSQAGRAMPDRINSEFRAGWAALIGSGTSTNRFRVSANGSPVVEVDLSPIDFGVAPLSSATSIKTNLATAIADRINPLLPAGTTITVSFEDGPDGQSGQPNENTAYLRLTANAGDVVVEPAAAGDLAVPLRLGAGQGGHEVSAFAARRPAPNGVVFDATLANLNTLGQLAQNAFNGISLDGRVIPLVPSLVTNSGAGARMFQPSDAAVAAGVPEGLPGILEKFALIADEVNALRASDPTSPWTAELWGTRLALISTAGGDNSVGAIATGNVSGGPPPTLSGGTNIGGNFTTSTRYYSLGTSGGGSFQTGGAAGSDGGAPGLATYRNAFRIVDREVDLFNLMLLPRDYDHTAATWQSLVGPASVFCQEQRAFLLVDPHPDWTVPDSVVAASGGITALRVGVAKQYGAVFYPRLRVRDNGTEVVVGPTGAIAGVMARIDGTRGVWKAPAGTEADLRGVVGLERNLTDAENGLLNPRAVNTIRAFPDGIVNWGARTLDGDNDTGSEYKYIPVRRLALFMEESLYRGLKWVVFEPNDEPLWAQIRMNVGAFMQDLFRKGAFEGATPREAYFVKCDGDTTTATDRNLGIVNIWVGFAPLKPAEFVVLYLQQKTAQAEA